MARAPSRLQKITIRTSREGEGMSLESCLEAEFAARSLPKTIYKRSLHAGRVYVNGRRAEGGRGHVKAGAVVDVYVPVDDLRARPAEVVGPLRVLYEDESIICFDKPTGLPTQPTVDQKRANLYDLARAQLGGAYLGLHHRLDRDTSGVILFTRDTKYNKRVAEQFSSHKASKLYAALVHGRLPRPKGRLESFLAAVGKSGKIQKFGSVKSGGKKAITEFSVLESTARFTLLEVGIATGRTHQIRVHLSEEGHPVVGDSLYGSPEKFYGTYARHMLHAHALTIEHPVTGNSLRIESPMPPLFREILGSRP